MDIECIEHIILITFKLGNVQLNFFELKDSKKIKNKISIMKRVAFTFVFSFLGLIAFSQKNFLDQAYIETSARADTMVVPDRIYLSIQLNEADNKNKKSVESMEKELEASLKRLGINTEKDLSLLDISSNYKNYFLKGQNVVKSKMYSLVVHDAVTVGKVLVELESQGISNVGIVKAEYSKADELLLLLKTQAIKKTQISAHALAGSLNQKAGKALLITEGMMNNYSVADQGIRYKSASLYNAREEAEPLEVDFQKIKFEAEVYVKYVLE